MAIESLAPDVAPPLQKGETPHMGYIVDALAGDPLRSLLVLIQAEANEPLTGTEQAHRLNALQSPNPACVFDNSSITRLNRACQIKLAPVGLAKVNTKVGYLEQTVKAFGPNPEVSTFGRRVAAVLLDWELQNSGHSLAQWLGDTASPGAKEGMPTGSLDIYRWLFGKPEGHDSPFGIMKGLGKPTHSILQTINALEERGALSRARRPDFENRRVRIQATRPGHLKRQRGKMRDIMIAIHSASMAFCAAELQEVSIKQLVAAVDYDADAVRLGLQVKMPAYLSYADRGDYGTSPLSSTAISIATEARNAIADLVLRIDNLGDPHFQDAAEHRATQILSSPEDVSYLIQKSRQRMSLREGQAENTDAAELAARSRRMMGSLTLMRLPVGKYWRARAECRDVELDPATGAELFFPIGTKGPSAIQEEEAKAVCAICPVVADCLQWSIDSGQQEGVFGGKTPEERRIYLAKPGVPELNPPADKSVVTNRDLSQTLEAAALTR